MLATAIDLPDPHAVAMRLTIREMNEAEKAQQEAQGYRFDWLSKSGWGTHSDRLTWAGRAAG